MKTKYAFDMELKTVKQINSAINVITDGEYAKYFDENSDDWKKDVEYRNGYTIVSCDLGDDEED